MKAHSRPYRKYTPRQRWVRRAGKKLLACSLIAALAVGLYWSDRLGLFGRRQEADLARYQNKTFRVTYVVDGDTIDIDISDGKMPRTRIRLWGVDTPETVKPNCPIEHFGLEASRFTKKASLGKDVRLELLPHRTRDSYDRLLAYVFLPDGTMLNRRLIVLGLGYADERFKHPHKADFARAMKEARRDRTGLWKKSENPDLPKYLNR
jgi:micrococcal nuclease